MRRPGRGPDIDQDALAHARRHMVSVQLEGRGIRDRRVLEAMAVVPRHVFVGPAHQARAYADGPLPIGAGQTISQPFMVALTCERAQLDEGDRVLEVGCGSGYQSAVLAYVTGNVVAIERLPELVPLARANLAKAGAVGVKVIEGDGTLGHPEGAPYDAIVVAAGAPRVPPALVEQLAEGGRLVIPVGSRMMQSLRVLTKRGGRVSEIGSDGCVFVPLIGKDGWKEPSASGST